MAAYIDRSDATRIIRVLLACSIRIAILLVAVALPALAQDAAPIVKKVDPPFWWAGQSLNPVRLLVRGENLQGANVRASGHALRTSGVRINERGTYLFVDVSVNPASSPGDYPLTLVTAAGRVTIPFRIEASLDRRTHFQGISNDDVIYLIMIDRFADGDPANDAPVDAPEAANDRNNPRAFHGGDIRGVINHLDYLKELGVTAIWLTPWYDNWNGVNNCGRPWCPNTYYHGYHAIDYYGVEDRFGTLATLRELVEKAHVLGIKVIQDQVANHVGAKHPWVTDPPLDNWFHGTIAHHELNRFRNSVLLSPYGNRDEVRNTLDGWFSDDLPDMNQDEPEVARYEIQNALWWVGATGIDAIRQDTIQYMPRTFIRDLSESLHRQYSKMWMVGEVFERDAAHTAYFMGGRTGWDGVDTKLDSVFDFSVWNVALGVFTNKLPMKALRDQLKYDALYPDPARLTTLSNNHDTPRFMSLDGATVDGAMMHIAFTLSIRGVPQLYYGEELGMEGKDDPDNRHDFPGGFLFGQKRDVRSAFEARGRTPEEEKLFEWTKEWIKLRREHSSMRRGRLLDLFYDDDAYVFARQDSNETVLIAFNRAAKTKEIKVSPPAIGLQANPVYSPLLGAARTNTVGATTTISIPPRTAVALRVS